MYPARHGDAVTGIRRDWLVCCCLLLERMWMFIRGGYIGVDETGM